MPKKKKRVAASGKKKPVRKATAKKKKKSITRNKKDAEIRKLKKQLAEIKKNPFAHFEQALPWDKIRRDGSMAKEESSLRHLGNRTDRILKRLEDAKAKSDKVLDSEAYKIAKQEGVDVREVFTLLFSP